MLALAPQLGADIALRLQQHRVHVDGRRGAAGHGLQRLGAADLAAVGGDGGVVGHVLRLERPHDQAAIGEQPAQPATSTDLPTSEPQPWIINAAMVRAYRSSPFAVNASVNPPLAQGLGALYIRGHMTIDHDSRLRRLRSAPGIAAFGKRTSFWGRSRTYPWPEPDAQQLDTFETLLEESDREIYAWIVGQEPTPAKFETDVLNDDPCVHAVRGARFAPRRG
jgi:antitoxin CptB